MVLGHHGAVEDGLRLLRRHRGQLSFWEEWIRRRAAAWPESVAVARCVDGLLAEDPLLGAFERFPPPARQRERYFMSNSVNGFLGWVLKAEGGRRKAE